MARPEEFNMNGTIPVSYTDNVLCNCERTSNNYFLQALEKFPIREKKVLCLGSKNPWYENLVLVHGGEPTILQTEMSENLDQRYDAAISFLYFKHLGLQDPPNPNADFEEMAKIKNLLKPDGLLYLSIPVGKDRLVWKSHRIYGEIRMKALFKGWRPVGYFGYSYEDLLKESVQLHEPVIVLKPL